MTKEKVKPSPPPSEEKKNNSDEPDVSEIPENFEEIVMHQGNGVTAVPVIGTEFCLV